MNDICVDAETPSTTVPPSIVLKLSFSVEVFCLFVGEAMYYVLNKLTFRY